MNAVAGLDDRMECGESMSDVTAKRCGAGFSFVMGRQASPL